MPYPEDDPYFDVCPNCPQCNGTMMLRYGKYGKFFGCANYPTCTQTENYDRMVGHYIGVDDRDGPDEEFWASVADMYSD